MNRTYNIWILLVAVLTLLYAFLIGTNKATGAFGTNIQELYIYRNSIFLVAAVFILGLSILRSYSKWAGMAVVNQTDRFLFNIPMAKERVQWSNTISRIEMVVFFLFAFGFSVFSPASLLVSLVFIIVIIDIGINILMGTRKHKYRVGITKKAIIAVDRDVVTIYFKGLKKISKERGLYYFEYVNDLVLTLPLVCIDEENVESFEQFILQHVDKKHVFFAGFEN